ncbi:MAG: acetyl-CoA C-acyltransferase [Proteobacteria bacterium]|nr:acetyl-CoA C-acyltransferase [Pseudomonadota bacterium]
MSTDVVVVSAVRTPIGRFGGALADLTAAQLGAVALRAALERVQLAHGDVAEVFFGCARQAGGGPNVARQVTVKAGLPHEVPAVTINQACASGLRAILMGAEAIMLGRATVVAVGGTESMSRVPFLLERARWGYRLGHGEVVDGMYRDGFSCPLSEKIMGETAETLAEQYGISRETQDAFALESQQKAARAAAEGAFVDEIAPVDFEAFGFTGKKARPIFAVDEHPRADTTLASLKKLPPVFKGTITAGNASGITDGAAALILMSAEEAARRGLVPLAHLREYAAVGLDPAVMGLGAALAAKAVLERAGLSPDAIDLYEVNEAFAAQVLACQELYRLPEARINVLGGSIALGHPIGCTGARITVTLLHAMRRSNARNGLATLCVSGGMGLAARFERPSVG